MIFRADNVAGTSLSTFLEQNFKINSLTFEPSAIDPSYTPLTISIAPGALPTNRLEIAPQMNTDGIRILSGATPSVTISAPVRLAGNTTGQTWNIADGNATLTLSGALEGGRDVNKIGDGKVILSAAASAGFNQAARLTSPLATERLNSSITTRSDRPPTTTWLALASVRTVSS